MGSEQSTLPAGVPGSSLRSQRDEDIPYTTYSISKPIDGESPRQSPRMHNKLKPAGQKGEKEGTPKHNIVVVAEGVAAEKDPDPELTKLHAIPIFHPVLKRSVNIPVNSRDVEQMEKLNHRQVLLLCLRYQEHLKQLSEAVAFDQNALCIRIKEIGYDIHLLMNMMTEKQRKYARYAEQFQRVSETLSVLNRVKDSIEGTIPKMERLNQILPRSEQMEPFNMKPSQQLPPN